MVGVCRRPDLLWLSRPINTIGSLAGRGIWMRHDKRKKQDRLVSGDTIDKYLRIRNKAINGWERFLNNPPKSPFEQIKLLKMVAEGFLDSMMFLSELNRGLNEQLLSLEEGDKYPNNRLHWGEGEDIYLIEQRAANEDIVKIAKDLGRTPAAVATRISTLIGIPREVFVERFINGELDGSEVQGYFKGTMIKK